MDLYGSLSTRMLHFSTMNVRVIRSIHLIPHKTASDASWRRPGNGGRTRMIITRTLRKVMAARKTLRRKKNIIGRTGKVWGYGVGAMQAWYTYSCSDVLAQVSSTSGLSELLCECKDMNECLIFFHFLCYIILNISYIPSSKVSYCPIINALGDYSPCLM